MSDIHVWVLAFALFGPWHDGVQKVTTHTNIYRTEKACMADLPRQVQCMESANPGFKANVATNPCTLEHTGGRKP